MPMGKGKSGGGSGGNPAALDKITYDKPTDTLIADASFQTKPSTVYLGSAFGMSNGVQAVGYTLADGTDAVGLVNRFDRVGGSLSNPNFFALGSAEELVVNDISSTVMNSPVEVNYTTAGDNLTESITVFPLESGRLRIQYWIGSDDSGAPIMDFHHDTTGTGPVDITPNFYLLRGGTDLFVRFSGVNLAGDGTLPYFKSRILPYKEITLNGHVEHVTSDRALYIGCDYAVDASGGSVLLTVPVGLPDPATGFTDRFRVFDYKGTFTENNKCEVDFSGFGQGKVTMSHKHDDIEFFYIDGDGWYLWDRKINLRTRV